MRRISPSRWTSAQRSTSLRALAQSRVAAIALRANPIEMATGSVIGFVILVVLVLIVPLVGAT